jgi:hypothetical protein
VISAKNESRRTDIKKPMCYNEDFGVHVTITTISMVSFEDKSRKSVG